MDTKEIVERVLKGEDYSTLVKEVPVEKQPETLMAIRDAIDSQVKTKKGDLEKATLDLISVRKGTESIKEKQNEGVNATLDTFKKEQLEKAKRKFFSEPKFGLTDDDKKLMENEITSRGIQSTDSDFVFEELKKIYGSLFADKMLEKIEKAEKGAAGAARFIQGQAGGSNTGPTGDPDKYTQPVKDLWQKVVESGHPKFTLDQAKDLFDKGRIKNPNNLSRKLA